MTKRLRDAALTVVALLFILGFESGFLPLYIDVCSKNPHAGDKECAAHNVSVYLLLTIGSIIDEHNGVLTAIFTAIIGYFTFTLWRSHDEQINSNYRIERAYISALGLGFNGTVQSLGSGTRSVTRFPGGPPNWVEVTVSNFGKTPGEIVDVRVAFLDGDIPAEPPSFAEGEIHYANFWLKPDTQNHSVKLVPIPGLNRPIAYGRVFYRDIIQKKLHSCGFILEITSADGSQPIRAPRAYSEDRDEPEDEAPRAHSALLPTPPPH